MTKPKSRPYKGWSVLSVSGPDWPKTRRADWPISVVLIGQNHGSHQSPLMELSNTIHTQCTRKRTLNAIIHTAIHNVHSHTSHSHNKFKQTRDRQQHPGPLMAILPLLSFTEKYWRSQKIWYVYCPLQWLALSWIYPLSWVSLWVSSRTHSFVMGRTSSESRSRTRAERTRSSCPLYVSMMRPTGQLLRGVLFAITRTKSFSWTFLWVPCHWVRWMRDDRYSLVHRFQNTSARYCTWRHFFLWNMSFSLNNPGGMLAGRWISRWLGVSGSRSLGLSEIGVSGLLFTIPSAITNNVVSISLVGTCSVIIANRTRRTVLICRSQTPPMCDAAGGLNIQRMPRCPKTSCILSWFHASSSFLSSRSAPTKFVLLSDGISWGSPLRAMNLYKQFIKESVSIVSAVSICIALVARQVNRQPYRFSRPRPLLTAKGPK